MLSAISHGNGRKCEIKRSWRPVTLGFALQRIRALFCDWSTTDDDPRRLFHFSSSKAYLGTPLSLLTYPQGQDSDVPEAHTSFARITDETLRSFAGAGKRLGTTAPSWCSCWYHAASACGFHHCYTNITVLSSCMEDTCLALRLGHDSPA